MDLRQVIGAVLTMSMFVMLGNMIKKEHIDPILVPESPAVVMVHGRHLVKLSRSTNGPWKEDNEALRPCWGAKLKNGVRVETKGFIYFSLTNGPEYHASQISNAILVAKHLGATLVLPDIQGIKARSKRHFGDVYDISKFTTSLDGLVKVVKDHPTEQPGEKIAIVKVPTRISKEYIAANIEPIFREAKTVAPKMKEVVDSMVRTLQHFSFKSNGKFIAVDLKAEELKKKSCQKNATRSKSCYDAQGIGQFLTKIGFERDTTIYLTQTGWHESLRSLREYFPNTFTKEAIMPMDVKAKYLSSEDFEFEKLIDFDLCTQSDVFVPAFYSHFQNNVVGMRIASGKTQILVPAETSSTSATDYLSSDISKKSHMAYSCFC